MLPPALAHLGDKSRFVAWKYVWKAKAGGGGKWDKLPIDPHTGKAARVNDAKTWGTFAEALACMKRHRLAGVGIVLFRGMAGGISGGDLDDCITDSGSLTPLAAEVLDYAETYAEISPSGAGIRLFFTDTVDRTLKDDGIGVEVYSHGRFLTITGQHWAETPTEIRSAPRSIAKLTAVVEAALAAREEEERAKRAKCNGSNSEAHKFNGEAKEQQPAAGAGDFFRNDGQNARQQQSQLGSAP
jgi:primase-polymerase (primpol)-like protein